MERIPYSDSYLDYLNVPSHRWPETMENIYHEGGEIIVPIYWRAHEKVPGVRDFSGSPRIRIERIFRIAAEKQFPLTISIGTGNIINFFPTWIQSTTLQSWIPKLMVDGISEGYFLSTIPSIHDKNLLKNYLDFLKEIFSVLNLYRHPGPIKKITIDLSIYHLDANFVIVDSFLAHVLARYQSIETLNRLYGTLFKTFENAISLAGVKRLFESRPWLASFDYKLGRSGALHAITEQIKNISEAEPLLDLFDHERLPKVKASQTDEICVFYDDAFVESYGRYLFPFTPQGILVDSNILAYRFLKHLTDSVHHHPISLLPMGKLALGNLKKVNVILSGKYLSNKNFKSITQSLETDILIYFPWGLPLYDENMESLSWNKTHEKLPFLNGELLYRQYEQGNGELLFSAVKESSPDKIINLSKELLCRKTH